MAKRNQLQDQLEGLFSDLSTAAPPVHEEVTPQPADDDVLRLFHEAPEAPAPDPDPMVPETAKVAPDAESVALLPADPVSVAPIVAPLAAAPQDAEEASEELAPVADVTTPQPRRLHMTAALRLFLAFLFIALVTLLIVMVFGRTPLVAIVALAVAAILAYQLIHLSGWAKASVRAETQQTAAHEPDEPAMVAAPLTPPAADKKNIELEHTIARLNQQAADLATGAEIARAVASSLDAQQVVRIAADTMQTRFCLHNVSIYLSDPAGETVTAVASSGEAAQEIVALPLDWAIGDDSVVGAVYADGQARFTSKEHGAGCAHLTKSRSELAVPLRAGGRLLGVLDAHCTEPDAFDEQDVHTFRSIADTIALSLLNAQQFAEKKRQSHSLELVNQLTDRFAREAEIEDIVTVALKQLGTTFDLTQATICLGTEAELLAAGNGQNKGEP